MKLYSVLTEDQIRLNLEAENLEQGIREMLKPLEPHLNPVGAERVLEVLLERERNLSTSIVDGISVPHARIDGLQDFILAIGSSPKGIPNNGSGKLTHLVFVILTPLTKNTLMLQTLAAVARLVSSPLTRQALLNVKNPSRALKIIEESGVDVKKTLSANDIMSIPGPTVKLDTPLTHAMELLADSPGESVPVVGDAGELIGELNSTDIIGLGLPKYMNLMENTAPLGNIEPFEQFFQKERFLKVGDLIDRMPMKVEPDTPVVQIAHRMISESRHRAYVVKDNKLIGSIYRKDIVTRVLML